MAELRSVYGIKSTLNKTNTSTMYHWYACFTFSLAALGICRSVALKEQTFKKKKETLPEIICTIKCN